MSGVNKAILIGNLGSDPTVRFTGGGTAVANFNIATTERFTDKSGEKQERTEWHRIVLFGRLAELAQQYLKKGRQVYIEGRIQTRQWEDKEGVTKYTTEIVGNVMQFLGGRGGDNGFAPQSSPGEPAQAPAGGGDDDDLPF